MGHREAQPSWIAVSTRAWARPTSGRGSDCAAPTMEGSSFSGLLTRVEIGHIRIGSAGYGCNKSSGPGSSLSQRS